MKYTKTKYKKTKKILTRLKTVKLKMDHREFLRVYVMNKNNEFVKRSFG